jgi:2-oxoglutarate ferredoxin oxidoreductase subunit delta
MPRIAIIFEYCKGCLLCATVCPKGIIAQSGRINQQGYKVVEVPVENRKKCKGCASCALICPDMAIRVFKPAKK